MEKMKGLFVSLIFLFLLLDIEAGATSETEEIITESKALVHIGAVFDPETLDGDIAEISINLAISDFYAIHPNYQTRLYVHFMTAKDLVGTATAGELVVRDCSRFVLVVWLWLAFILMQSYTASLSSILTVDQLEPEFTDLKKLRTEGHFVGFQNGSFVGDFLQKQLNFSKDQIKPYINIREYKEALSNGSEKGGASAIFEEIPYIRVFLKKYGSKYTTAGPIYRTDGLGFAFPRDSPLVSHFSQAILLVRENATLMDRIEKKYFGETVVSPTLAPSFSTQSPRLRAYNFGGLFIIAGIATLLALVMSEKRIWQRPVAVVKQYLFTSQPLQNTANKTEPAAPATNIVHNGAGLVAQATAVHQTNTVGRDSLSPDRSDNPDDSERINSGHVDGNTAAEEDVAENSEAHSS